MDAHSSPSRREVLKLAAGGMAFPVLAAGPSPAASTPTPVPAETTLFAFDDHSIPWWDNLQLTLLSARKHPDNPVLRRGPEGSPDHGHAALYGSVLRVGDVYRMWYLGMGQRTLQKGQAPGYWRPMCYAESRDGIHWTKPELGLVEYGGNTRNNICRIEASEHYLTQVDDYLTVLYEPDDPDPGRRYKAAFIVHAPWDDVAGGVRDVGAPERRLCAMVCAVSADGLCWRVLGDRPCVNEKFEVSGLYRFGNFYYAEGQQISPWAWRPDGSRCGRVMMLYRSPDLVHWSSAKALAFARPGQLSEVSVPGQQTHMGAGIWNRGNVLVGLYGMWQDGPAERPKGSSHLYGMRMDLGLVLSNDGIHFREPVPGFKVIPRGAEGEWDSIALEQGHAFANVGDETYVWYGHWDCEGQFRSMEIGLATLRRDGFGHLACRNPKSPGHFITRPLAGGGSLALNVDGVSDAAPLRIHLLDPFDRPLPGFSGADAALVARPGTRCEVRWPRSGTSRCPDAPFAVRVELPPGEAKVYAIYATTS